MNKSHYLKLIMTAFFLITPCLADGVAIINDEHNKRLAEFNATPLAPETYTPHTTTINDILKDKHKVDVRRQASNAEKETILKAVMASVVIHKGDSKYRLPTHELNETHTLYKHFEILRLTEELADIYWRQFINTGNIRSGEFINSNLYTYSGLNWGVYFDFFYDVINQHHAGVSISIAQEQKHIPFVSFNSIPSHAKEIPGKFARTGGHSYDGIPTEVQNVLFGDIGEHPIAGHETVFVSTYSLEPPLKLSLIVRLPDEAGHQRRILMQTPPWDVNGAYSPYEIRAHPLFSNGQVALTITHGENPQPDGSKICISGSTSAEINTHDGTFSPNDAHLTNLPERALQGDEIFSFISTVTRGGFVVDTFHLLIADISRIIAFAEAFLATDGKFDVMDHLLSKKTIDYDKSTYKTNSKGESELDSTEFKYDLTDLGQCIHTNPNKTFGEFLSLLQHPFMAAKHPDLPTHLEKMMAFIDGRI